MALTTIQYGSIASSQVMNQNFSYLDDKITDTSSSIMTIISSIISNIATINSKLAEIENDAADFETELNSKLSLNQTKTNILINKICMIPNWNASFAVDLSSAYTAASSGYILMLPAANSSGNITVNNKTITLKSCNSDNEKASQLIVLPVQKGDLTVSEATLSSAYFVPAAIIDTENVE